MLIKCTVYKNGIKHNEFPLSDIAQFLNKPEYIIWAAFRDANKEELSQIQDIFDLHEVVMEETNELISVQEWLSTPMPFIFHLIY